MAIFRCNKCGHIREVGKNYVGRNAKCPECQNITAVYDTVPFLKSLIQKYIKQSKELKNLRNDLKKEEGAESIVENLAFDEIDIHNTNVLTQDEYFGAIYKWFEERNIQVHINKGATDTRGFFDEIALILGDNFKVLSLVSNQIKYIQNKKFSNVKIELSKRSDQDIQALTSFCQELYDYSFVAKYFYHKKDKIIRLTLQTAPKIRAFFNGVWMEWFTLMKLLEFFRDNKIAPACARGLELSFANDDSNEIDLFFVTENNIPVFIECKSGEFRHDIDKYLLLRKKLKIDKSNFIICVFGLSQEQAVGMTSMYDLTFVNETSLIDHVKTVV